MIKNIKDWVDGWEDCTKGEPQRRDTKDYKDGYGRRYQHDETLTHIILRREENASRHPR